MFRSQERKALFDKIVSMTETRFRIAEDLYAREPWDLFAVHEIGTDRLNHAYTKYFDEHHPDFVRGNPYKNVARDYYRVLDTGIARLLSRADPETRVMIVSDHGSMPMDGCFCINQWLAEKGYLAPSGTCTAWDPTRQGPGGMGSHHALGGGRLLRSDLRQSPGP